MYRPIGSRNVTDSAFACQRADVELDARIDRGSETRWRRLVVVARRTGVDAALRKAQRVRERIDALNQMDDSVGGVEAVELVVDVAGAGQFQVGFDDARVVKQRL